MYRRARATLAAMEVKNYAEAAAIAKPLADGGITAIELRGGFGNKGTARICKAVKGKAGMGAVRFDRRPGLEGKSGDKIFQ